MDSALEIIAKVSQSTSIPLFMMSLMTRVVRGSDESIPESESPLSNLICLEDAFEPETEPIWDTQLPLLQTIWSTPFPGVEVQKLEPIFARCQNRFPEIFEGTTFSGWLTFCEGLDLILIYDGRVLLSSSGKEFMEERLTNERICVC